MALLNAAVFISFYSIAVTSLVAGVDITTGDDYQYTSVGGDFSDKTSVSFTVKACNDAHITLQPESASLGVDQNGFEIVIGGWGNKRSVIRSHFQQRNVLASADGQYLSCNYPRSFWVSWAGGKIRVGTGHFVVDSTKFMEALMVKAVAVSTGWGSTGYWAFDLQNQISISTENKYSYQMVDMDFSSRTHVNFMVQACNDAHVSLQAAASTIDEAAYEIVIGGWRDSKSVIRSGFQSTNLVESDGSHLSCDCAKPLWVSWADNKIRVGEGYTVSDGSTFMEALLIRNIAVATGWGATGVWKVYPY